MYFLKADDIVVFDKLSAIIMFQFFGALRGRWRSNKTSSIPCNTSETAIKNMDTRVLIQTASLCLWRLKRRCGGTGKRYQDVRRQDLMGG